MKEYVKPTVEVVNIKVKDEITARTPQGQLYTIGEDTITYYVLKRIS